MKLTTIAIATAVCASAGATQFFNADSPANNVATRANFLTAAGVVSGEHFEDFESYAIDTNMQDAVLAGDLKLHNSGTGSLLIKGAGAFGSSNPIGNRGLWHNESTWLELVFQTPALYIGLYDIDQAGATVKLTYTDGSTQNFSLDTTGGSGNTAEFFGFVAEGGLNITKVQMDASGDGGWGIDNLEYGVEAVPEPATLSVLALAGLAALRRRTK